MKLLLLMWCMVFGHSKMDYIKGLGFPSDTTARMMLLDFRDSTDSKNHKTNSWDVNLCSRCGLVYWKKNPDEK